jgi:hypothetical protein
MCIASEIAGLVTEDIQKEGDTSLVPYLTTFKRVEHSGMTLLIGGDHGIGHLCRCLKLFIKIPKERHCFHEQS